MPRPRDPTLPARLRQAAAREFAEQGFAAARMDRIGAAAGVTKGGVYLHFRSKEDLFFAALDGWRAELLAEVAARLPGGPGAAALREFLRRVLALLLHAPEGASLLRVLATELRGRFAAQAREDARGIHRALRARLRELFAAGMQDGSLSVPDPAFAAFVTAAAVVGIVEQWLTAQSDAEPFCHVDRLAAALAAPFAPAAGAAREPEDAGFTPPLGPGA
jgi:AcrR family transcriptional regulator